MFRSFLVITFRILWRNKVTSFVNIFGLSVGIAAFIFIMLYVYHEVSYDRFNEKFERIYRLEADDFSKLPPVLGKHVKDNLPEIENIALLPGSFNATSTFSYSPDHDPGNLKQISAFVLWADSTTFDVFTFPFVQGNPRTALKEPMTAVLTESASKKLFGVQSPMGKMIEFDGDGYMITGIIRDIKKFHIEAEVLVSMASIAKEFPERNLNNTASMSWLWSSTYLLMKEKIDAATMEDKVNDVLSEINNGAIVDTKFHRFRIRPLKDLYFHGELRKLTYGLHGNLKMVEVLVAIGIFMLLLACINYINLSTARSSVRAKELAVKRVTGSSTNQLRFQLIAETVVITLISLVVAVTLVQLLLSKFKEVAAIDIQLTDLNRLDVWSVIIGTGILFGLLAGLYPAFYMTSLQPISLIKGAGVKGPGGALFRSWLMTFQFALSVVMIVAIVVNFRQLRFMRSAYLGFDKEHVITFHTPDGPPDEAVVLRASFKERLLTHSGIENVAYSYGNPGMGLPDLPTLDINGQQAAVKALYADPNYLDVMGIQLAQGRNFSADHPGDQSRMATRSGAILINESMAREFALSDPLGKKIYTLDRQFSCEIIGVVKDFHFRSLHDEIEPLVFMWFGGSGITISIKVAPTNLPTTIKNIESEFRNVWGLKPFEYQFMDENFNRQYKSDEQLATVIGYFALLAIIIACLGLFALSSFMVSRRRKEIGIRKTMGASLSTIFSMISWDFLRWILLAIIIGCPAAWLLMQMWLQTFAFHISLSADIFLLSSSIALVISLMTIAGQSFKAANANPIDSLRYE